MALSACVSSMLLGGCLVGPDYHRPNVTETNSLPSSFERSAAATNVAIWTVARPAAGIFRGAWWEIFEDQEFDRLESLANSANQDLAAAAARFEQARAVIDITKAGLFPQVTANFDYARQRVSAREGSRSAAPNGQSTYSNFILPLEATWELDLWGRVRRQVEAARGRLTASADDFESAKLAVQAEVAANYFALCSALAELDLLRRSSETFLRSLQLTRNRRAGGIVGDLDVAQAETQLRATEAQIPAVELQINRLRHSIAVLCGQIPTRFEIAASKLNLDFRGTPPAWVPSELLERRPDIAAAENRMAAANAEIGVATSAFYPRIRLAGAAGFQSLEASSLFDWPARTWAIGPSIELPLFTGSRNRANLAASRASYDEAVAVYRQIVLRAFQEVEDELAVAHFLTEQLLAEQAALTAARRTLEIADNRYKAGLVTYLEVASAQSAALNRERAVVQLSAQRLVASAGLIRALGGGWTRSQP